jgi:hypothetical protein
MVKIQQIIEVAVRGPDQFWHIPYIYIYIYVCVCVCVCARARARAEFQMIWQLMKDEMEKDVEAVVTYLKRLPEHLT